MLSRITSDGLLGTMTALIAALMKSAAYQRYQVAIQAGQILHDMCDRINDVIVILAQHIDFWSDLSARITHQLNGLTPKNLTKNNGQITMGIAKESEEEWGHVEALYQQYASTVSLPRQLNAVIEPIDDFVLHRHGLPTRCLKSEHLIGSIGCGVGVPRASCAYFLCFVQYLLYR